MSCTDALTNYVCKQICDFVMLCRVVEKRAVCSRRHGAAGAAAAAQWRPSSVIFHMYYIIHAFEKRHACMDTETIKRKMHQSRKTHCAHT